MLETGDVRPCLQWFNYWTEFGAEASGILDVFTRRKIDDAWLDRLPARSVGWFADFFVLGCIQLDEDFGLGPNWMEADRALSPIQQRFIRGRVIGPLNNRFNPTGDGSYFLTVDDVCRALTEFPVSTGGFTHTYVDLLERCGAASMGVYNRVGHSSYERST